jgi:hypothetical protein
MIRCEDEPAAVRELETTDLAQASWNGTEARFSPTRASTVEACG